MYKEKPFSSFSKMNAKLRLTKLIDFTLWFLFPFFSSLYDNFNNTSLLFFFWSIFSFYLAHSYVVTPSSTMMIYCENEMFVIRLFHWSHLISFFNLLLFRIFGRFSITQQLVFGWIEQFIYSVFFSNFFRMRMSNIFSPSADFIGFCSMISTLDPFDFAHLVNAFSSQSKCLLKRDAEWTNSYGHRDLCLASVWMFARSIWMLLFCLLFNSSTEISTLLAFNCVHVHIQYGFN